MAKEYSFDISAKINMQSFKDAINLVDREVTNRFDFKGTNSEVDYKEKDKLLILVTQSDYKLDADIINLINSIIPESLFNELNYIKL